MTYKPEHFYLQQQAHEENSKQEHHKPTFAANLGQYCEDQTWFLAKSFDGFQSFQLYCTLEARLVN